MLTKMIKCKDCGCKFEHIIERVFSNHKRFCDDCAKRRKKATVDFSNKMKATGKPIGRPIGRLNKNTYIEMKIESISTWDEPNFGGY